jgi:uncharacterized surface protein with fasciclin (FAS1) repeats
MPTQPGERHEGDCTGQKGGGVDGMVVLIHFRDKTSTVVEKPQEQNADSSLEQLQFTQNQWVVYFFRKIKKIICATQILHVFYTRPAAHLANRATTTNQQPVHNNMKIARILSLTAILTSTLAMPVAQAADKPAATQDIVAVATGAGSFKTLVAAVKAAGLVETLQGKGPFTVFAPTDEAFAKLPAGTVEGLLKPENKEKLAAILTYHVVSGKVMAADVKTGEVKTVNGKDLSVKVADGKVTVNGANVVTTDIAASNGVIHVIDTVVLPK